MSTEYTPTKKDLDKEMIVLLKWQDTAKNMNKAL